MNSTLELLVRQARLHPTRPAFEAPGRPALQYQDLAAEVEGGARRLANAGVASGDAVALVLPDGPELATAFLAATAAGIAAPLNPALAPRELRRHLERLKPRCAVLAAGVPSAAREAARDLGIQVVDVGAEMDRPAGTVGWSVAAAAATPRAGLADLAIVLATSGTTSRPKLVGLSHANLLASAGQVSGALELTAEDAALCMVPLFHGSGLFNVLLPSLAAGARVVLAPGFVAPQFFAWLEQHRPSWYQGAPAMHQSLLSRAAQNRGSLEAAPLRFVRSSSAPLPPSVLADLENAFRAPVVEGYGMTEANQIACNPMPPRARKPGTVGLPTGTEVAIRGDDGRHLPPGATGEVLLRGPNVMAGYLEDAAANAAAFVDGWFRSGDVGHLDGDGYLTLTGRLKELINRGGEKIAPREVDEALLEHPAVAEAMTFAMPHATLGEDVAAAVRLVPGAEVDAQALREHVAQRLAPFKVPARLAFVDAVPRGPTGKPQRVGAWERLGLTAEIPAAPAARSLEPAVSETEAAIARIWARTLGLEQVGRRERFLDLGGDSVLAARIALAVSSELGIELPLVALFETPTVASLAALAERAGRLPARRPVRSGRSAAPCSAAQRQLWLFEQLGPEVSPYVHTEAFRLAGELSLASLQKALDALVARHEILRTTYAPGVAGPEQRVAPPRSVEIRTASLDEPEALAFVEALGREPFDLAHDLALRAGVVRRGERLHVLALVTHHVALDAWSLRTLVGELAVLYGQAEGGDGALAPLPIQYADYAAWHGEWVEREVLPRELPYWTAALAGETEDAELPADRPRPPVQSHRGGAVQRTLSRELSEALGAFGRERGVSLFTTLLAGFTTLLHRVCRSDSVRLGVPVAGRPIAEALPLVGVFANLMVLRSEAGDDPTFAEAVERARGAALGALAHQDVPFESLVAALAPPRRLSHNPLFQVAFNWREYEPLAFEPAGLRSSPWPARVYASRFDLTLYGELRDGRVAFTAEYATDLFDATTVARWLGQLETLLQAAVAHPGARLSALPLDGPEERARLVALGNDTAQPYRSGATLAALFDEAAARAPDALALVAGTERLTYAALAARAAACASAVAEAGAAPGAIVGVALERSPESVAATLAVAATGATLLALDPSYPEERLRFLVEDSGARVVVALGRPAWLAADVAVVDPRVPRVGAPLLRRDVDPDAAAFLIYTSGSSGPPKGVLGTHRAYVNRLEWMARAFPWEADDVACLKTSAGFVDAVAELWGPLLAGVPSVLLSNDDARDPRALAAAVARHGVTRLVAVPSLLEALLDVAGEPGPLDSLRVCVSSGEPLTAALARRIRSALPAIRLLNLYGSTEVAADATAFEVRTLDAGAVHVPVGRPIANTRAYVLDAALQPVPLGAAGELWIGGVGVAAGYHRRPELTAERFVPDPFDTGGRLFRTGDLAKRREDGELELLGRADDQLKIRGARVEPGEVEAALRGHPAVLEAAVSRAGEGARAIVVGTLVLRPDAAASTAEILEHARQRLPGHAVPSLLRIVDRLPRTTSGKLDRRALARDASAPPRASEGTPPLTPTELTLAAAWSQTLRVDPWREADFFALGGHSLSAVRLVDAVDRLLPGSLTMKDVFAHPRLEDMARYIDAGPGACDPEPVATFAEGASAPLSFGQERLWFLERLHPGTTAFHLAVAADLDGPFDDALWREAVRRLVLRHAALRTVVRAGAAGLVQSVEDAAAPGLVFEDAESAAAADEAVARVVRTPFAKDEPPFRAARIRLAQGGHRLVLVTHHAISDGWSLGLLVRDLGAAYREAAAGTAPAPAPRVDALAFARWQRRVHAGERLGTERAFWRERLAPSGPPLDLPADRPRPRHRELRGARVRAAWSAGVVERLRGLAAGERVTPFTVLLTAFKLLLRDEAGVDDVRVATFVAGRERREFEDVVGFFVNTVVLRTDLDGRPTFREALGRVAAAVRAGLTHARLPFEQVVAEVAPARDPSRPALAQVAFVLQTMPWPPADFGSGPAEFASVDNGGSGFDLTLYLRETRDGLTAVLEYDTALFDAARMERLLDAFGARLQDAVADPDARPVERGRSAVAAVLPPPAEAAASSGDAAALEPELLALWRDVLGRPELTADTSFFDAGGHSLLSVALFERMEARFGRRLPIATLFDAPSVRAFARTLAGTAERPGSALFAVRREGSRPPLFYVPSRFFMHRDAINVAGLSGLSARLGADQPFYSFCVERAEDATGRSVDALAEAFVSELRAVQPRGPYRLVGTSSGGLVVFAMATRLAALGDSVALLALLDTYAPGYPRRARPGELGFWAGRARRALAFAGRLRGHGAGAGLRALAARLLDPPAVPLTLRRPGRAWRPEPFPGRVLLFRSSLQERYDVWGNAYDDPLNGWGRFTSRVEPRAIPGRHDAMLSGESLDVLGDSLRAALDEAVSADAPGAPAS